MKFSLFPDIEGGHGTVITHHPGPDFAWLAFCIRENDLPACERLLIAKVCHDYLLIEVYVEVASFVVFRTNENDPT
jgi:hypothetical protein